MYTIEKSGQQSFRCSYCKTDLNLSLDSVLGKTSTNESCTVDAKHDLKKATVVSRLTGWPDAKPDFLQMTQIVVLRGMQKSQLLTLTHVELKGKPCADMTAKVTFI